MKVFVTVKKFYSKLNLFFSNQDDPYKGIEHLISLEESAKRWYVTTRGYPEVDAVRESDHYSKSDNCVLISSLIEISLYISMSRITLLCFTDNHFLNTYCGDVFIGTSTRFYMNATFALAGWLVVIFRSMLFWSDRAKRLSWLTVFTLIKHHGFNSSFLRITPAGANELRNKVYLGRKFLTFASPLTVSFISGIMFVSFLTNSLSFQSRKLIFFQFFWSTLITVQATFAVVAGLWLVVHVYLLTSYCSLQLDAINLTIDRLILSSSKQNQTHETYGQINPPMKVDFSNSVHLIVASQNHTSGYISQLSDQLKYYIAIGYFYASFGADFLLYSASVMPTDRFFNNIIVTGLGVEILFLSMLIILVLSKVSSKVKFIKLNQLID